MAQVKITKELFKKVIHRREENTEALEKREKGDFKVRRFMPLEEKVEPSPSKAASDNPEKPTD